VTAADLPLLIEHAHKSLAGRAVLIDVSLSCPPGTLTALLGPNGAGKTTTVTLATGLRRADSGTVQVFGATPRSAAGRRSFSLVPQDIAFPAPVAVSKCLDFVESQRESSELAIERDLICAELGVEKFLHRSLGALSGGQRRKVALALGLLRVPPLLILDEATSNLDDLGRQATWRLVREYADRGGAVLATTHILGDIESHANRVIALNEGRVVRSGSLADIRHELGGSSVSVTIDRARCRQVAEQIAVASLASLHSVDSVSGRIEWRSQHAAQLVALLSEVEPSAKDLTVTPTPLSELLAMLGTGRAGDPTERKSEPRPSEGEP